ncbi:MAG: glycosyltransferase family 39 protein [Bdellovibrionales bacterium]|nr:glycosyltransferase family 39 protein [Bdellovibrionales bacterium]
MPKALMRAGEGSTPPSAPIINPSPGTESRPSRLGRHLITYSLLATLLSFIWFAGPMGNRPFFTKGEAREAIVVQSMLETGDYVLPFRSLQGLWEYQTKPPLFHWLGAAFAQLPGISHELAFRLPSALLSAFAIGVAILFFGGISGRRVGLLSALLLLSSFEWSRSSGHARVDMVFAFGVLLSMVTLFFAVEHWLLSRRVHVLWWLGFVIAGAIAILGKGPFGLLYPCAVGAAYALWLFRGEIRTLLSPRLIGAALLSAIAAVMLAGLWYLGGYLRGGDNFLWVHFFQENLGRFATIDGDAPEHAKPFYFGPIYLLLAFLPGTFLLPVALAQRFWTVRKPQTREQRLVLFCLFWVGLLFLVVTISQSKRMVYFLPALPALAYLTSAGLERVAAGSSFRWASAAKAVALILVGLIACAGIVLAVAAPLVVYLDPSLEFIKRPGSRFTVHAVIAALRDEPWSLLFLGVAAALAVQALRTLRRGTFSAGTGLLCIAAVVANIPVNYTALPAIGVAQSPRSFAAQVKEEVPAGQPVVEFNESRIGFEYYYEDVLPDFSAEDINAAQGTLYIVARERDLADLRGGVPDTEVIRESENYAGLGKERLVLLRRAGRE